MGGFSKIGFLLAALGSSIGLGQIWRFPYMVADNGGGAFIIIFLVLILTIGISILMAEMIIGNAARKDPVESYRELDTTKSKKWYIAGFSLFGGIGILCFYCVVLGWVLYYMLGVSWVLPASAPESLKIFNNLLSDPWGWQLVCFYVIVIITGYVIYKGVEGGIEKLNFILMPLLFVIFIGLVIYSATSPYFGSAVKYLFDFKPEAITPKTFVDVVSQIFFSLSIGIGIIIAYAASSPKKQNLFKSSLFISIAGVCIALMAGLMIFTVVFQYTAIHGKEGIEFSGPGLVFKTLPLVFHSMGFTGKIISFLFFLTLGFAGITSTISLLEPGVMYLADVTKNRKVKLTRTKSTLLLSLLVAVVGTLVVYSDTTGFKFLHLSFWDWLDFLTSDVILIVGGLCVVIFVGWVIKKETLKIYASNSLKGAWFEIWYFIVRYISPIILIIILYVSVKDGVTRMIG
ncbi:hypothetical protein BKH43_01755 [Helicobacter sp. 13S00401-1]|uniref:sodium-dependent transporter n=1 Tax=Helicobacter sp. 13S00401-1 TaxID=1905758 RepID=UPI000BA7CBD7|nr:sodium-dependent transporter [Helicobacter sp. 13S00401-1]PAF51391.1 hypothetical protein BKH43_01755 [Helicobacter sp. 13S00401-1]